jgi:tetratricopeptide (TPR) repeat protein
MVVKSLWDQFDPCRASSLLNRVWQRLSPGERELIPELAVFRRHAPCDIWRLRQQELDSLVERNLAHHDGRGGVALLPAFRPMLYNLIPTEDREVLHHRAAKARRQRGEFTAGAYHYLQAGRPREAILLWHDQRVQEINQGQGQAALALFNAVSISQVSGQVREKLVLLRGELQKRTGDYPAALRTLQLISWQTPMLKMRAKGLGGDIYELQDQFGQAIKAYQHGLSTAATAVEGAQPAGDSPAEPDAAEDGEPGASYNRLPYRLEGVYFYKRLSRIYMRQRAFDRAWRESLRARYEVEDIQGMIQEHQGNYADALACYRGALGLAQACEHTQGEARTRNNLLRLLVLQATFEEAFTHGERAYQLFRLVGDLANQASVRVNQALGYNQAGQPERAVELAEEALALFEQLGEPSGRAVAAQNLAEAHLALGNLHEARRWVERVLREEETSTIPDALRTWGEIELAEGKYESAAQRIRESLDAATQNKDTFLEAYAWRALGRMYLAQGKMDDVVRSCDKAIALFEKLGVPHEVAATQALGSQAQGGQETNGPQMLHAVEEHDNR